MTSIADTSLSLSLPRPRGSVAVDKILLWVFVIYLITNVIDGVLRFVLVSLDLPVWLLYLRDVAVIVAVGVAAIAHFRRCGMVILFVLLATLVHGMIGWFSMHSAVQVLFGVKVLLTVAFGAFVARPLQEAEPTIRAWFMVLWGVAAIGVLLNAVIAWPWTGMVYSVGDIDVEAARDWSSNGVGRAAGFSRFSISAGIQLSILAIYLMATSRTTGLRGLIGQLFVFAVTLVGLHLTDSKGGLASVVVVTFALWCFARQDLILMKSAIFLAILPLVLLPVFLPGFDLHATVGGLKSMQSFLDRMQEGWPDAWHLIFSHGMGILGRGIGGIGSPQRLFAPELYNPGDNLTIFVFAYFGIFAAVYLLWPLAWVARLPRRVPPTLLFGCAMVLYFLLFGIVMNIFEDQVAAAFLGITLAIIAAGVATPSVGDATPGGRLGDGGMDGGGGAAATRRFERRRAALLAGAAPAARRQGFGEAAARGRQPGQSEARHAEG